MTEQEAREKNMNCYCNIEKIDNLIEQQLFRIIKLREITLKGAIEKSTDYFYYWKMEQINTNSIKTYLEIKGHQQCFRLSRKHLLYMN